MGKKNPALSTIVCELERLSKAAFSLSPGVELTIRLPENRTAARPTAKGRLRDPVAIVEFNGVKIGFLPPSFVSTDTTTARSCVVHSVDETAQRLFVKIT
jgi:hypothetical protein